MPGQSNRQARIVFRVGMILLIIGHFLKIADGEFGTLADMSWNVLTSLWSGAGDPESAAWMAGGLMGMMMAMGWLIAGLMLMSLTDFLAQSRKWLWIVRLIALGVCGLGFFMLHKVFDQLAPSLAQVVFIIAMILPVVGLFLIKPDLSMNDPSITYRPAKHFLWAGFILFVISQIAVGADSFNKIGWAFTYPIGILSNALVALVNGSSTDWWEPSFAMIALPFVLVVSASAWALDYLMRARPILTIIRAIMMLYLWLSPFLIIGIVIGFGSLYPLAILPFLASALLTFIGIFLIPTCSPSFSTANEIHRSGV
jgi:hypothetical protein